MTKMTLLKRSCMLALSLILIASLPSHAKIKRKHQHHAQVVKAHQPQSGVASYYAAKFHGRRTASGEIFNKNALTAAHKTLPFGTKVKVTCLKNGQSVVVRINDRGPHVRGRVIDLTYAAAKKINLVKYGTARVKLEVLT